MAPTPITIVTGFLGSGKTTLILKLIPQLPPSYKLALLKNEFGDLKIDSELASSQSIAGVQELLNGCICCNLVGQLGDALETLRKDVGPDRIVIETSGSAFPATLAMEVNRLGRETGNYSLDGVVVVIDVENWRGYDDTSYTAKLQARYTDLVVFNKWEQAGERRFDECLDRLGDLEVDVAWLKSDRGSVSKEVLLGLDRSSARELESSGVNPDSEPQHSHGKDMDHQSEVEVLSLTLTPGHEHGTALVDTDKLERFLKTVPKDEIYRIKAVLKTNKLPASSDTGVNDAGDHIATGQSMWCILNWAFGRWTFTRMQAPASTLPTPPESGPGTPSGDSLNPPLRMTIILARHEAGKWKKRIEGSSWIALAGSQTDVSLRVERIL